MPTSSPDPEGRLTPASCLNHVWHFGRCGIRVSGTQHAKNSLCHVNLCADLCGLLPGFPGNLCRLPGLALFSPAWQPRDLWLDDLGTHAAYPGSSLLALVLSTACT